MIVLGPGIEIYNKKYKNLRQDGILGGGETPKHTVDANNPAPVDKYVCPIIYRVLYTPGGCLGFLSSTVFSKTFT